jgi:hypothetical protein
MKTTTFLAASLLLVAGALVAPPACASTIVLSEDFEAYANGSNLAGQGGWVLNSGIGVHIEDANVFPGGPSKFASGANIIPGGIATGVMSTVSHPIAYDLGLTTELTLDFLAHTINAPVVFPSNNAYMAFGTPTSELLAHWVVDLDTASWFFRVNGSLVASLPLVAPFAELGIVVDRQNQEIYGTYDIGNGALVGTTSAASVPLATLNQINRVVMIQDLRFPSLFRGIDVDNIQVIAVPEPHSIALLGLGMVAIGGCAMRRRRRRKR